METWIDSLADNGNVIAIAAGVVGALATHALASRFRLNNGFRLIAATAG